MLRKPMVMDDRRARMRDGPPEQARNPERVLIEAHSIRIPLWTRRGGAEGSRAVSCGLHAVAALRRIGLWGGQEREQRPDRGDLPRGRAECRGKYRRPLDRRRQRANDV